jgi:hypothetical protein
MPDRGDVGLHPVEELVLYAYDELAPSRRPAIDAHLATCAECRREIDLMVSARDAFDRLPAVDVSDETWLTMLDRATTTRQSPVALDGARARLPWRLAYSAIAAAALVTIGALGAYALGGTRAREVQRLRAELADARVAAAVALLREPWSADRLRGVSFGSALLVQDRRISAAFTHALRTDPSPNVRLAVLDAMEGPAFQAGLAREVLAALPEEPLPAVRLAMIELLERTGDAGARGVLETLSRTDPDAAVRSRARSAAAALTGGSQSVQQ